MSNIKTLDDLVNLENVECYHKGELIAHFDKISFYAREGTTYLLSDINGRSTSDGEMKDAMFLAVIEDFDHCHLLIEQPEPSELYGNRFAEFVIDEQVSVLTSFFRIFCLTIEKDTICEAILIKNDK